PAGSGAIARFHDGGSDGTGCTSERGRPGESRGPVVACAATPAALAARAGRGFAFRRRARCVRPATDRLVAAPARIAQTAPPRFQRENPRRRRVVVVVGTQ